MNSFVGVFLIIILVSCFQTLLSYKQVKSITTTYKELIKKYSNIGDYYIGYGKSVTSLFSLKRGNISIIVVNDNYIVEAYEMRGYTVFSKMKYKESYLGEDIFMLKTEKNKNSSIVLAIDNILKEKNKLVKE